MIKILPSFFILAICIVGCSRGPVISPDQAMRSRSMIHLRDDLNLEGLQQAVESQIKVVSSKSGNMQFGPRSISYQDYNFALSKLLNVLKENKSAEIVLKYIQDNFEMSEVYGNKGWGEVLVTGYFEPIINGSLKQSSKYSQALYRRPEDMINLDLSDFDQKYSDDRKMRGRIVGKKLVPYYTRQEIDSQKALAGRGLELCWVDPIDAFFLQIQGSGTIALEDGSQIRLAFADKNGQAYKALGAFLTAIIPLSEMSLDRIETYLRTLNDDELRSNLNKNPSYIFFEISKHNALTSSGVPATSGRTIATDKKYFPRGALAYLEFQKSQEDSAKDLNVGRIVVDQDSGGAILGTGRVDLFWGRGDEAKLKAGRLKSPGHLFYFVPK